MSKRPADLLLNDILEAIGRIEQYIKGLSLDDFSKDQKTIDAVARNLEIIGEASNRLPDEFKEKYWEIEWYKVWGCGTGLSTNTLELIFRLSGKFCTRTCLNCVLLFLKFAADFKWMY